jgi:hypothetical protein
MEDIQGVEARIHAPLLAPCAFAANGPEERHQVEEASACSSLRSTRKAPSRGYS